MGSSGSSLLFVIATRNARLAAAFASAIIGVMRVYHFVDSHYGLMNVRTRRLKVATLEDINDPFEMLSMSFADPDVRRRVKSAREDFGKRRGLLCFSRGWRDPVQWSHYADRHRGVCLGFDVPDERLREVRYGVDRRHVSTGAAFDDAAVLDALDRKFLHWAYEDEVRMVVPLDRHDDAHGIWFRSFGPDLTLAEIVVGAASDVTRADVADALGDLAPTVSSRKARLAFRDYSVATQRRERLWR